MSEHGIIVIYPCVTSATEIRRLYKTLPMQTQHSNISVLHQSRNLFKTLFTLNAGPIATLVEPLVGSTKI
jgi:hypothetical protein